MGIAAAVIVHGGRVLLVRRAHPEGSLVWQFPAGKREVGETVVEAAVREAHEEAGVVVSPLSVLGERTHPTTGHTIGYVACVVTGGCAQVTAAEEVDAVRWCDRAGVRELITDSLFGPVERYLNGALR